MFLNNIPSIIKKQIVAVTGLGMVGFLISHLSGNFLFYAGPKAFNAYAAFLHSLGKVLWVARIGLIGMFITHIIFTVLLVIENKRARSKRYAVYQNHGDKKSLAVRLMPYTGSILLAYVILHLIDFTFPDKSVYANGLYELVSITLSHPVHAVWYMIAMACVGFHLSHGIQSVVQTFGISNTSIMKTTRKISLSLGIAVGVGFGSIPLYIVIFL